MTATIHTLHEPTSPGALDTVRLYFDSIHPARGHGKTDCGEMLDGLCDGDHFLWWLGDRGFVVTPSNEVGK